MSQNSLCPLLVFIGFCVIFTSLTPSSTVSGQELTGGKEVYAYFHCNLDNKTRGHFKYMLRNMAQSCRMDEGRFSLQRMTGRRTPRAAGDEPEAEAEPPLDEENEIAAGPGGGHSDPEGHEPGYQGGSDTDLEPRSGVSISGFHWGLSRPVCYKACILSFFRVIRVNNPQTQYIGLNRSEIILADLNLIFKFDHSDTSKFTGKMAQHVVSECNPLLANLPPFNRPFDDLTEDHCDDESWNVWYDCIAQAGGNCPPPEEPTGAGNEVVTDPGHGGAGSGAGGGHGGKPTPPWGIGGHQTTKKHGIHKPHPGLITNPEAKPPRKPGNYTAPTH